MNHKIFTYEQEFPLQFGGSLAQVELSYSTLGSLNANRDNVIWVCHALTANSEVSDWWSGLIGEGKIYDPEKHFIICVNVLGSHYGSTGPLSINPKTGRPYYGSFPQTSIRDIAHSLILLRKDLGIEKINTLIGGSIGGQQAIEWSIIEPDNIENLVVIASNAKHSPWGVAFNETQRLAIATDRTWGQENPEAGIQGMKTARAVALLSYRNYKTYQATQEGKSESGALKASAYQKYQGEKLAKRFNAYSYWTLSVAMDNHDVSAERGSLQEALGSIKAKTLVVGLSSDILFPVEESRLIASHISEGTYAEIGSLYGHDGFLIETPALTEVISKHFNQ